MEKNYYLAHAKFKVPSIDIIEKDKVFEITQLVQASSKQKAKEAIEKDFKDNSPEMFVLQVKVYNTIIGD